MRISLALGVMGLFLATSAYAAKTMTISAEDFVKKAAVANQFEVESSKLALDKSQSNNVKWFARRMVEDHTDAGKKLTDTVNSSNVDVEVTTDLDDKHQRMISSLEASSGEEFDRKYISMQNAAHQEAVELFSNYSRTGKNPQLRSFASETLPTLEDHFAQVKLLRR